MDTVFWGLVCVGVRYQERRNFCSEWSGDVWWKKLKSKVKDGHVSTKAAAGQVTAKRLFEVDVGKCHVDSGHKMIDMTDNTLAPFLHHPTKG